jgi:hypothetical protein
MLFHRKPTCPRRGAQKPWKINHNHLAPKIMHAISATAVHSNHKHVHRWCLQPRLRVFLYNRHYNDIAQNRRFSLGRPASAVSKINLTTQECYQASPCHLTV